MIKFKKVYKVNGRLVVANDIKDAIDSYQEYYPYSEISTIMLMEGDNYGDTTALIKDEWNGLE